MTPCTHEQEVRCAKRRARAMNSLSLNVAGSLIQSEWPIAMMMSTSICSSRSKTAGGVRRRDPKLLNPYAT
jgi:hypothetical protein